MVSLVLLAAVALSSAYVVVNAKRVELTADVMNAINQEQTLALQKVRIPSRLKEALIGADSSLDLVDRTSHFSKCFGSRGTACKTRFDTAGIFRNLPALSSTIATTGHGSIVTSGSYSIACSQEQNCELLKVRLESNSTGGFQASNQNLSRHTVIQIPGRALSDRQQISFDCITSATDSPILTGMDLKKLMAICTPLPSTNTADCSLGPMTQYRINNPALCQNLENLDCAGTGIQRIGALANQGHCWPVTTTTLPPVPTTTTTSTSMTSTTTSTTSTTTTTLPADSWWWCRNAKSSHSSGNYNLKWFAAGDGPQNYPNLVCQLTQPPPDPNPGLAWFCKTVGSSDPYCPTAFGNGQTPSSFPNLECIQAAPGGSCI